MLTRKARTHSRDNFTSNPSFFAEVLEGGTNDLERHTRTLTKHVMRQDCQLLSHSPSDLLGPSRHLPGTTSDSSCTRLSSSSHAHEVCRPSSGTIECDVWPHVSAVTCEEALLLQARVLARVPRSLHAQHKKIPHEHQRKRSCLASIHLARSCR